MVVNITAGGVRCDYRVFGYRSGGGGTLVFDSGGRGQFGQAIDITGAGFDYYNVIVSAYDDTGTQIQVGTIDSAYIIFAYGELVQLPTTPPELVEHAASIDEGINGGQVSTLPTDDTELPTIDDAPLDTSINIPSEAGGFLGLIGSILTFFMSLSGLGTLCTFIIIITLAAFFLYGRGL